MVGRTRFELVTNGLKVRFCLLGVGAFHSAGASRIGLE